MCVLKSPFLLLLLVGVSIFSAHWNPADTHFNRILRDYDYTRDEPRIDANSNGSTTVEVLLDFRIQRIYKLDLAKHEMEMEYEMIHTWEDPEFARLMSNLSEITTSDLEIINKINRPVAVIMGEMARSTPLWYQAITITPNGTIEHWETAKSTILCVNPQNSQNDRATYPNVPHLDIPSSQIICPIKIHHYSQGRNKLSVRFDLSLATNRTHQQLEVHSPYKLAQLSFDDSSQKYLQGCDVTLRFERRSNRYNINHSYLPTFIAVAISYLSLFLQFPRYLPLRFASPAFALLVFILVDASVSAQFRQLEIITYWDHWIGTCYYFILLQIMGTFLVSVEDDDEMKQGRENENKSSRPVMSSSYTQQRITEESMIPLHPMGNTRVEVEEKVESKRGSIGKMKELKTSRIIDIFMKVILPFALFFHLKNPFLVHAWK